MHVHINVTVYIYVKHMHTCDNSVCARMCVRTYTAAHQNINQNIHFGNKVFYGEDGIHNYENISLWDDRLMFQSHIAGDWNDNCWNEENYRTFSTTLESLAHEYPLNYTTLGEVSEDS